MTIARKATPAPAPQPLRIVPIDAILEMRASLALSEQMARRSEDYAKRDPAQIVGAIRARDRADKIKALLEDTIAHSEPGTSTFEQMMRMTGLSSEIVQAILPLRDGTANSLAQQAIFNRMVLVVFALAKKERTLAEIFNNADDGPEGVPYNGKPQA